MVIFISLPSFTNMQHPHGITFVRENNNNNNKKKDYCNFNV